MKMLHSHFHYCHGPIAQILDWTIRKTTLTNKNNNHGTSKESKRFRW